MVCLLIACSRKAEKDNAGGVSGARSGASTAESIPGAVGSASLDTVWAKGGPESEGEMAFGILADATIDAQLSTYLLDRATLNVRVLDREGNLRRVIGRSGRGPGEFSRPLAVQHDGEHTLYVLDDVNGLVAVDTDATDLKGSRSFRLPFPASDFCFMGDRIVVYGAHDGHPLHVLSAAGEVLRSFGEYLGPREHPRHQPAYNDLGKVACFPDAGVVVTTTRYFPQVSAYNVKTTELIWRDSMPAFVPYAVIADERFYSIGQQQQGSDKHHVLRPIDASHVLVQSKRVTASGDEIKSCVYSLRQPHCEKMQADFPSLVASRGGYSVALAEDEYSYAALLKVQLRQR
jgi:hypothetical protein